MTLVFATNNTHKLREAQQILGMCCRLLTPAELGVTEEIPEDQPTLEGNALAKARYVFERTGRDCFADDTGLEVAALGGAPGVRSARYATDGHDFDANIRLLLRNLAGAADRSARFRTAVALIMGGREYLFEGEISGIITENPYGCGGFGYDSVFIPDGWDITFAEMKPEDKNRISHRAIAMGKLAGFLESLHENL